MDSKNSTGNFIKEQLEKLTVTTEFDDQEFKIIAPKVTKVDYEYDNEGKITKSYSDVYGTNIVSSFDYDEKGNCIKVTTVINGDVNKALVTTKEYDDQNRIIKSDGPEGLETFVYNGDITTRIFRDYSNECDIEERYTSNSELLYSGRTPAVKGYIDKEMTVVNDDSLNLKKVSYKEDIEGIGVMVIHEEIVDMNTDKIISIMDLKPTENGPIQFRVDFEYNDEGDITATSMYENDILQKKESTDITKENDVTIVKYNGMITKRYNKDGFTVVENAYHDPETDFVPEESIVANSAADSILIEKNITIQPQPRTIVRISGDNFSIALMDNQIIDIDITIDNKCYEYGSDVHGSGVAYAAVTPSNENNKITDSTKVEYSRAIAGSDTITDYMSNKVYEFIDSNERIKTGLKLVEVDYAVLKKE